MNQNNVASKTNLPNSVLLSENDHVCLEIAHPLEIVVPTKMCHCLRMVISLLCNSGFMDYIQENDLSIVAHLFYVNIAPCNKMGARK